jgi:hypothetical protein
MTVGLNAARDRLVICHGMPTAAFPHTPIAVAPRVPVSRWGSIINFQTELERLTRIDNEKANVQRFLNGDVRGIAGFDSANF